MKSRPILLVFVLCLVTVAAGFLWRRNIVLLDEMKKQAALETAQGKTSPLTPTGLSNKQTVLIEENNKSRPMTWRDLHDIVAKTMTELKTRPKDPQLRIQLAVALSLGKKFDEAAAELETASRLAPRDAQVRGTTGMFYMRLGDAQAALPHLQKAYELSPLNFEAITNLAKAHWVRGEIDQTLNLLQKADRVAEKSAELQEQLAGLCTELPLRPNAVRAWRKLLKLQPNSGLALQQLAFYEVEAGNIDTAKTLIQKALLAAPTKGSLHSLMGTAYVLQEPTLENLNQAEKYLNKAIELGQGQDSATRYYLGKLHRRRGNLALAAEQLEAAAKINPNYREAHYDLAQIYAAMKRSADAQTQRQIFSQIFQNQNNLNLISRQSQTSPNNANLHYELAKLQLKSNNIAAALPHLQKALELRPHWPEVRQKIAKIHKAVGRPHQAERYLAKTAR